MDAEPCTGRIGNRGWWAFRRGRGIDGREGRDDKGAVVDPLSALGVASSATREFGEGLIALDSVELGSVGLGYRSSFEPPSNMM